MTSSKFQGKPSGIPRIPLHAPTPTASSGGLTRPRISRSKQVKPLRGLGAGRNVAYVDVIHRVASVLRGLAAWNTFSVRRKHILIVEMRSNFLYFCDITDLAYVEAEVHAGFLIRSLRRCVLRHTPASVSDSNATPSQFFFQLLKTYILLHSVCHNFR